MNSQVVVIANRELLACPSCPNEVSVLYTCEHRDHPHCARCHDVKRCRTISQLQSVAGTGSGLEIVEE